MLSQILTTAGSSGSTSDSNESDGGAAPVDNVEMLRTNPMAVLIPLIRTHLYRPVGQPPLGWSDRRDGSLVLAFLRQGVAPLELADAIIGLAHLRDTGELVFAGPGTGLSLRPLWKAGHGPLPLFRAACLAADELRKVGRHPLEGSPASPAPRQGAKYRGADTSPTALERARSGAGRGKSTPQPLADLLPAALHRVTDG